MRLRVLMAAALASLVAFVADAAELRVISTQAPEQAYRALVPEFEKASGHKVTTVFSGTVDIDRRLASGEIYDVLIMARPSIDAHTASGKVVADSRIDLARSGIVLAVRAGTPRPDIGTTDAFKKTLLSAKSIGYSTGPSGVYLIKLFQRLGITDEIKGKLVQTPTGVFVGSILSNGEVEIGLQQVSELIAFPGCDIVGPLPADIQQMTQFTGSVMVGAKEVAAAREWLKYLVSPAGAAAFRKTGMDPG
ncbi:extracellular solute-binding protein [Rhodoplanes roseus]|uniref:ABC transporter substrate-binding protein n=1 Tax=Rhodoplanes roseus TaxID=29409 RepID=A0A327KZ97_9BRAD|nr:substrate-binding domain-containing protein [Rhodoplanes roseus]RAI42945.1 hypothetical protein CH341_16905 [Rhodoplanes roseus]